MSPSRIIAICFCIAGALACGGWWLKVSSARWGGVETLAPVVAVAEGDGGARPVVAIQDEAGGWLRIPTRNAFDARGATVVPVFYFPDVPAGVIAERGAPDTAPFLLLIGWLGLIGALLAAPAARQSRARASEFIAAALAQAGRR